MDYSNEIEDIKLKIKDIKYEIKAKRNVYRRLTSTLNDINIKNSNEDYQEPLLKSIEIKVAKQDILNEIVGEKIGGISQYYYDKLQEAKNYKIRQMQSELKSKEDKKLSAETVLEEIENLKEEESRLLNDCQKLINQYKKCKKQDIEIAAPRATRRTR